MIAFVINMNKKNLMEVLAEEGGIITVVQNMGISNPALGSVWKDKWA